MNRAILKITVLLVLLLVGTVHSATITTSGRKVLIDGEPFFALGVYYQREGSLSTTHTSWQTLKDHRFNLLNLSDPFPVRSIDSQTSPYASSFRGFITANQVDLPWLSNTHQPSYNNPTNAQSIMQNAAAHDIYVIADQAPFTPDGARALNGTNLRTYGIDAMGNDVINATKRQEFINNLALPSPQGWSHFGIDHDNFFGWNSLDEPVWFWGPYEGTSYKGTPIRYNETQVTNMYNNLILDSYNKIKAVDSTHVVFMNFAYAHGSAFSGGAASWNADGELVVGGDNIVDNYVRDLRRYSQAADIIAMDIYPIHSYRGRTRGTWPDRYCLFDDSSLSVIGKYQKLLNERVVTDKPVYQVLQSWTGAMRPTLTTAEVRFQAYDAIINGAAGLLWFGWHVPAASSGTDLTWERTKVLVRDELSDPILYPVLSADTSPLHSSVSVDTPDIEFLLKKYNGQSYLFAAILLPRRPTAQ